MASAAEHENFDIEHGLTLKTVQKVLDFGFTSVMFDGSVLSLEENM